MKLFTTLLFSFFSFWSLAQNPYTGTWESYEIRSFKERYKIKEGEFSSFKSVIVLRDDLTYTKTTEGIESQGKYEFDGNKFYFYRLNRDGSYAPDWMMRWPKNTTDPSPATTESFDLNYPEVFAGRNEKGVEIPVELDVYYRKTK